MNLTAEARRRGVFLAESISAFPRLAVRECKRSHMKHVQSVELLHQKSSCALIFMNRADSTDVGVSHGPLGMNAWL